MTILLDYVRQRIMDLWVREARIFKYGSGTGSNLALTMLQWIDGELPFPAAVNRTGLGSSSTIKESAIPRNAGTRAAIKSGGTCLALLH